MAVGKMAEGSAWTVIVFSATLFIMLGFYNAGPVDSRSLAVGPVALFFTGLMQILVLGFGCGDGITPLPVCRDLHLSAMCRHWRWCYGSPTA